ncbi:MAG: 4Fe-4S dicluster domain-containing protein [Chloroflexota bacterium]|nr:4Fe-4S dicluster domain-containing protein [Chloroflexota bacterium]
MALGDVALTVGTDLAFSDVVREWSGEDIHSCYYCQKCTAGCPTAFVMDLKPAQLLRMIQLGQKERVLSSKTIWMCIGCEACGTRCPNQIRLAPVMDVLRQMALDEGYTPETGVYSLHRSFLDSIRMWGRMHELTMLAEFKTRELMSEPPVFFKGLLGDMKLGADLVLSGKLSFLPDRIKGLEEIRALYQEVADTSARQERTEVSR